MDFLKTPGRSMVNAPTADCGELHGLFIVRLASRVDPKTVPAGAIRRPDGSHLVTRGYASWSPHGFVLHLDTTAGKPIENSADVLEIKLLNGTPVWASPRTNRQ